MRWDFLVLLAALALTGCRGPSAGKGTDPNLAPIPEDKKSPLIVNPASSIHGRIIRVNPSTRYVIIRYPFGNIPAVDRKFNVYRNGLKVAEIKINDFRRDTNIVADIVVGECQVGDEVRED